MSKLAPHASDPAQSRGRLHPVDATPTRSEFQRDRDRIIHSSAFRRLQYKTQVFLHHEGRHFRTRLTHTLEVSQIARSIARSLNLNEDLAEAIALAHDLGHPPFGHAGERVLDEKMRAFGGFDHNMQALRVVTRIENRYADHNGLNLTWETLEGILKHNGPLVGADGAALGKYRDEGLPSGIDEIAASADLLLSSFPGPEAQAAAVADDIAYNSHDIDDAVRAGLLDIEELASLPITGEIVAEVRQRWPGLERARQTHEVQRRLITRSVENVIATSEARLRAAAPGSADDVRAAGQSLIATSEDFARGQAVLKQFLFDHVYRSPSVMRPVEAGQAVVSRLFDHLLQTGALPGRWAQAAAEAPDRAGRARVVCDFVAGMTDPFAVDLYVQVFDARPDFG